MTYQRKVDEFESLLTDYARDGTAVQAQIHGYRVELQTTQALTRLEEARVDTYKEQIGMAEERIKFYKGQRDQKELLGEQIYNQIRDSISFQEERQKSSHDELTPLKHSLIPALEHTQSTATLDIENYRLHAVTSTPTPPSQTQNYQLSGEVAT